MSFAPTAFRPHARSGWGGRAATAFRPTQQWHWRRGQIGTVVYRSPGNQIIHGLAGITRDSVGAALASCTVDLFSTTTDQLIATTVSDGAGAFSLPVSGPGGPFYLVAYKVGAPDVAGTTVNTLIAI